jgi:aminoglycoside phosphotransferase (APT) family kinase protein
MCEVSRHRWVSVTPWLDAVRMPPPEAQTGRDRRAVVGVLAELHAATTAVAGLARPVDLALPERAQLDRALDSALAWPLDQPYAEAARNVLHENAAHVARALTAYDREAARALESRDTWVLTHGEPHWRNVLVGPAGLHVVDWDTARLAPPARDLWHATGGASAAEVHELLADYERLTGLSVAPAELRVQSLRWDLEEVALYVAQFSRPHFADDDTATAWRGLSEALSSLASRSSAWAGPAERSSTSGPR